MANQAAYIMSGNPVDDERGRLSGLEAILDPGTIDLLDRCTIPAGGACLEVGPGAGSIARRLRDQVGPDGRVVVVDLDPSTLRDPEGLEVVAGDVTTIPLAPEFDLVHSRATVEHCADPEAALRSIVQAVAPGGSIAVECLIIPGENVVAPDDPVGTDRKAIHDAMTNLGRDSGIDFLFGYRVPWLLKEWGLTVEASGIHGEIFPGGDARADFYRISFGYLRDFFLEQGTVTQEALDAYIDSAHDADHFQFGPLILFTLATRPA